jgi:hypothetical protein
MTQPQRDDVADHQGRVVKAVTYAKVNAYLTGAILAIPVAMVGVLGIGWTLHTVLAW